MEEEEGDDIQKEPDTPQDKHSHGVVNIYTRKTNVNRLAQPQQRESTYDGAL